MKKSIAELPMMAAPREKEELIIYLAAAKEAISAVLMTERDGKKIPIYFVSRALRGPETNYTPMEKLVLALVSASKRLKIYFQEHTVIVITDQPIKQMLSNPEVTGRLLKWSFELEEHDIQYWPRTSVKGQILADFIVERSEDNSEDTLMKDEEELPDPWTLFTDGSSCSDSSGAGLILLNPEGMEFTYALRFRFDATNHEAEYEALITGLKIVEQMGAENLQENVDSRLVANQVNGRFGLPGEINSDNGKQFQDNPFKNWCEKLCIRQHFAYVKHPQTNGLVERANRSIGEGIKARLDERSKRWMEELPHVLWAHRTMIKSNNEDTPFSLTCITKAVIPA
ncbi:reverse transcriptase domain-containing protein [Tanacetum coccineum]